MSAVPGHWKAGPQAPKAALYTTLKLTPLKPHPAGGKQSLLQWHPQGTDLSQDLVVSLSPAASPRGGGWRPPE